MEKEKATRDDRVRNWTAIVYPESAPENWREIINGQRISWVESPLHEFDTDENGEVKKSHWHVLFLFEGKKSFKQIQEITDSINAPKPEKVASVRSLVRYMAHLDDPERYQYKISDIKAHGGADIASHLKASVLSRHESIAEMVDFIIEENISEFIDFLGYARHNRRDDWFPVLCDSGGAYVIGQAIKSKRNKSKANNV